MQVKKERKKERLREREREKKHPQKSHAKIKITNAEVRQEK